MARKPISAQRIRVFTRGRTALLLMVAAFAVACTIAPLSKTAVDIGRIPDGVYAGTASSWPNRADVLVTVRDGRITGIDLVRHWASWIGRKAEVVPQRIIEKQSANVDAVTGATNSSRVIMHAVHNALLQGVRKSAGEKVEPPPAGAGSSSE